MSKKPTYTICVSFLKSIIFNSFLEVNYLTVRSRFATQGLISSHGLRQAFPDFDKRRLAE
jgi:hypothetical protein